jgi:hypothetical protein
VPKSVAMRASSDIVIFRAKIASPCLLHARLTVCIGSHPSLPALNERLAVKNRAEIAPMCLCSGAASRDGTSHTLHTCLSTRQLRSATLVDSFPRTARPSLGSALASPLGRECQIALLSGPRLPPLPVQCSRGSQGTTPVCRPLRACLCTVCRSIRN